MLYRSIILPTGHAPIQQWNCPDHLNRQLQHTQPKLCAPPPSPIPHTQRALTSLGMGGFLLKAVPPT